jgi:hypothetical protein
VEYGGNGVEIMDMIDPFLMQLVIVPFIVIGIGIIASIFMKNIVFAPLITLILNLLYELWYSTYRYSEMQFTPTSWNVIFPLISFVLAWTIRNVFKE